MYITGNKTEAKNQASNHNGEEKFQERIYEHMKRNLLEEDFASAETDRPIGIAILWKGCNFVGIECNYFILDFQNSHSLFNSISEVTPCDNT